jgi:hypothetical protein
VHLLRRSNKSDLYVVNVMVRDGGHRKLVAAFRYALLDGLTLTALR